MSDAHAPVVEPLDGAADSLARDHVPVRLRTAEAVLALVDFLLLHLLLLLRTAGREEPPLRVFPFPLRRFGFCPRRPIAAVQTGLLLYFGEVRKAVLLFLLLRSAKGSSSCSVRRV